MWKFLWKIPQKKFKVLLTNFVAIVTLFFSPLCLCWREKFNFLLYLKKKKQQIPTTRKINLEQGKLFVFIPIFHFVNGYNLLPQQQHRKEHKILLFSNFYFPINWVVNNFEHFFYSFYTGLWIVSIVSNETS